MGVIQFFAISNELNVRDIGQHLPQRFLEAGYSVNPGRLGVLVLYHIARPHVWILQVQLVDLHVGISGKAADQTAGYNGPIPLVCQKCLQQGNRIHTGIIHGSCVPQSPVPLVIVAAPVHVYLMLGV